jgi:DNA-binding transcriptional LysR family regulator
MIEKLCSLSAQLLQPGDTMRTEQLEYVTAISRLGSFRRAAEELHISQPALSETVRNLERELGVDIFQRGRSGASLTADGQQLLAHVAGVIDAVDGLRRAAGSQHQMSRMVRVATVNAGTVPVLTAAIAAFRLEHPDTQVEIVGAQEEEIHRGLREGSFDLGLVTRMLGDDVPPELDSAVLLSGPPVVCLRPDDPLAAQESVSIEDLLHTPLIVMRAGYLMHRYLHRLLGQRQARVAYSAEGAEMGKLLVVEGLGVTVLPQFSVIGDPLERCGLIVCRPLADDLETVVHLDVRRWRSAPRGRSVSELHRRFLDQARVWSEKGRREQVDPLRAGVPVA